MYLLLDYFDKAGEHEKVVEDLQPMVTSSQVFKRLLDSRLSLHVKSYYMAFIGKLPLPDYKIRCAKFERLTYPQPLPHTWVEVFHSQEIGHPRQGGR